MPPGKNWTTKDEAYDIRHGCNIINVFHAERELGQCFADKADKIWEEIIPFSADILEETTESDVLVPDWGLSIIEMRGFHPNLFQDNQYGHFTWEANERYLQEKEEPTWRLICKSPQYGTKQLGWKNDLKSHLKLISQSEYVPSARQIVNFLILAGAHSKCWENFRGWPMRTGTDEYKIGVATTVETTHSKEGKEIKRKVIKLDVVSPITNIKNIGIVSAKLPTSI